MPISEQRQILRRGSNPAPYWLASLLRMTRTERKPEVVGNLEQQMPWRTGRFVFAAHRGADARGHSLFPARQDIFGPARRPARIVIFLKKKHTTLRYYACRRAREWPPLQTLLDGRELGFLRRRSIDGAREENGPLHREKQARLDGSARTELEEVFATLPVLIHLAVYLLYFCVES
ncbi:hypothetical protein VTK73DRAFT_10339 [Phialemonium thermophilum]|uniref:Uncharacterized protein n=1 Tax=Phialemonium thermophilum TaxID=223376 RepID=A0ABR3VX85_9PEZI